MERALIRQEISKACKRLALTQQVVTMCEATPRQEEFLYQVLSQELAYRERLRRERLLKRAAFPVRKTLDDYEWTALRLPAALPAEDVTSCNFVRMKRNLILYGPVGTGKTHLAIALGVAACEAGSLLLRLWPPSWMGHAGAATWRNCYNPLTGRNW